jgi:hypothetical protein
VKIKWNIFVCHFCLSHIKYSINFELDSNRAMHYLTVKGHGSSWSGGWCISLRNFQGLKITNVLLNTDDSKCRLCIWRLACAPCRSSASRCRTHWPPHPGSRTPNKRTPMKKKKKTQQGCHCKFYISDNKLTKCNIFALSCEIGLRILLSNFRRHTL